MDFEQIIFGKKKFSDLLKDIYSNSKEKEKQIKDLIENLSPLIKDNQSALMIVPLLSEYLNISVKNDEQLIKLAGIVQKALNNKGEGDNEVMLSEAEKSQLYASVHEVQKTSEDIKVPNEN